MAKEESYFLPEAQSRAEESLPELSIAERRKAPRGSELSSLIPRRDIECAPKVVTLAGGAGCGYFAS